MSHGNKRQSTVLYSPVAGLEPARDLPTAAGHPGGATFLAIRSWAEGTDALAAECPCAVVVPLTRDLLERRDYVDFIAACTGLASEREAFRLYIHLVDLSCEAFVDLAHSEQLLGDLADTVNIPSASGPEGLSTIDAGLASFLRDLADIEDAPRCRMKLLRFFAIVSALSLPCTIGSLAAAAALAVFYVTRSPIPGGSVGSLLIAGNSYLLLTAALMALAQRSYKGVLLILVGATAGLDIANGPPYLPLLGGLALALGTDYCRRSWISLLPVDLSRTADAPAKMSGVQGGHLWRLLLHGYVFDRPRCVFLSYARRTWCDGIVRELCSQLRNLNTDCFLDVADIELGSSWRHALEDGIRRATVMVFFDQDEPLKPPRLWHRVELLTAAALRRRTGLPSIVVVTPASAGTTTLQSYREKLSNLSGLADFHIVPLSAERATAFSKTIARTPLGPYGGDVSPITDLLVRAPLVALLKLLLMAVSCVSVICFFLHLCLILPAAQLVLTMLGMTLPVPSGVVSSVLFLSAGYAFREWLHSAYEAVAPCVRVLHRAFAALTSLNIAVGALFLVHSGFDWWVFSAAALLLAFVARDNTIRWCGEFGDIELRSVVKRV